MSYKKTKLRIFCYIDLDADGLGTGHKAHLPLRHVLYNVQRNFRKPRNFMLVDSIETYYYDIGV